MNAPPFAGGQSVDDGLVNAEASATGHTGSRNRDSFGEDGMGHHDVVRHESSRAVSDLYRMSAGPTSRRAVVHPKVYRTRCSSFATFDAS